MCGTFGDHGIIVRGRLFTRAGARIVVSNEISRSPFTTATVIMMLLDVNPFRASRSAATVHWAANVVATAAAATSTVGTVRPVRGRRSGGDSGNKVE